jgi:hypothetical protein
MPRLDLKIPTDSRLSDSLPLPAPTNCPSIAPCRPSQPEQNPMCSQSPDIVPSQSACRQDRLGARWDSRLGISSDKVLSCPSTHFLPRRSLVIGTQLSSWRHDSCQHGGEFLFNRKLSKLPPHPQTALDHVRLSPLTNSIAERLPIHLPDKQLGVHGPAKMRLSRGWQQWILNSGIL